MRAGPLRHIVTIQRLIGTETDSGAVRDDFEDWLVDIAASVEEVSGRESWVAEQVASEVDARIRIRYRDGITPQMRVVHKIQPGSPTGADIYDIVAPIKADGRKEELHLMCKKRDAEGFRTGER